MDKIIIRQAKLTDDQQLLNLYQTAIFENRQNPLYSDNIDLTLISEQSNIREHFKNNNIYLVAWVDNQIVGKLVFTTSDSNHGKMEIYIRQEFRRQGIGNELIKYLLTWSKKTKLKEIKLEVLEDNKPAINLYKKFGWQTENKDGKIYKIKEKNINSLIMTKLL